MFGRASSLVSDAMLMMLPRPRFFMPGIAACATTNGALRLVSTIASKSAIGKSATGCRRWMPALLTTTSSEPCFASIAAMPAFTASTSVTSNTAASTLPPSPAIGLAAASSATWSRPFITTVAPARASPAAMPRPMPRAAPVTSATRPVR